MRRILFFVLLLLLASCTKPSPYVGPGPITGSEGIVVHETYVPEVVYEGEEFSVTFEVENRGAHTVSVDYPALFYVNYDALYLDYVDSVSRFPEEAFWLQGRDQYRLGDSTFFTLYFNAYEIERFSQEVKTPILFTVCYPYESIITQQVCIEQIRDAQAGAVACTNTALRPMSPGAPIGIRQVDVRTRRVHEDEGGGLVPSFRITLENYGDGIPSTSGCSQDEQILNTALVRAFLLDQELECGYDEFDDALSDTARFIRGQAVVSCSVPSDAPVLRGLGNFVSLLTVYADYTYRDSDKVEVKIVRE